MTIGGKGGGQNTVTSNAAPPPDVMAQYDALIKQANAAAAAPLQQYNGQTVAGFTPQQESAFGEINNAQGLAQPLYGQAQGLIQNASQPINYSPVDSSNINQYMNPYTQDVINSTLANVNQQDAGQQQQLIGNAASQGAWGGDRSAVAQSLLANQQDLAKNQTIAGLENQNYSQALGEANTQQQAGIGAQEASQYLGQQGGAALTNLGTTSQNAALQGASTQLQSGALQQQLAQEQLNVPYQQFLQQQAYPFQNIGWLSGISTGLGSGSGGTSSTTSPAAGVASQLGGLGLTGLGVYGASGGFSGSTSGMARGGAIPEGLIKRLATGGAVMMPAHYDIGGGVPGQMPWQNNPNVPDLSVSYIPGAPSLSKSVGISMMKPAGSTSKTTGGNDGAGGNAGADIAAAKGLKGLIAPSKGASGGLGNANMVDANGDSVPMGTSGAFASGQNADIAQSFNDAGASMSDVPVSHGLVDSIGNGLGITSAPAASATEGAANTAELSGMAEAGLTAADTGATIAATDAASTAAADTALEESLAELLAFKRGGPVKKYADGGLTPFDTTSNPFMNNQTSQYSQIPVEQLHQLAARIPATSPQGQIIQKVLQQKQAMPNASTSTTAPMAAAPMPQSANRGGLIKGYATDGAVDDMTPDNAAKNDGGNDETPLAASSPSYSPTSPINKPDPWLSLAAAGAGMMASKSPHALEALGEGAQLGLQNYGAQKKQAAEESYQQGTIEDAKNKLAQEADQFTQAHKQSADQYTRSLALDQQKADQQAKYQNSALALQKIEANKPIFDKAGNPWQLDPKTNTYVLVPRGQIGSGQNAYGLEIGTVPQGSTAPVLDPKYDPTVTMPPTQKAISDRNMMTQLEKDNKDAAVNNDSIARLQAAKNVITTAPTGGITNLLGVGPLADAFSTQRQELGALNKELAMAPGERPTNMRLTQGEVMMLKQAQPGNDKSTEANSDIADANIAIRTRPAEFANFKNDFIASNGYWNDAIGQQMFNKYVNENPIIDVSKSGQGKIVLNQNRQTIEQYANNGGFAKYGVKGNPQNNQTPAAPPSILPLPSSKDALITNKVYQTAKGPATWNGTSFIAVSP